MICAGGTLGILIPPSIMLIVYSATASVSVVRLYAAAMLPGFLLASLYIGYVVTRAVLNPSLTPKLPKEESDVPWSQAFWLLVQAFVPLAVLILSVLGSILFGLATPTEAAAVGAFGSLVLAVAYRALTWQRLREAVYLTSRTIGDGLLPVRRLVDVLLGVLVSGRRRESSRISCSGCTSTRSCS